MERELRRQETAGQVLTFAAPNQTHLSTASWNPGTQTPLIVAMRTKGQNQDQSRYLAFTKVQMKLK